MVVVPASVWQFEGFRRCLSLADLNNLASTCRDWQDAVLALYKHSHARQLVQALQDSIPEVKKILETKKLATVEHDSVKLLKQLRTVVNALQRGIRETTDDAMDRSWGPILAATPGLLSADYTQICSVPDIRYDIAKHFVQHLDVRITYQQLVTAAHNKVNGAEVWVQVQHELGIQTDIPDIAVKICILCQEDSTGLDLRWLEETEASLFNNTKDLLAIALNARPSATAESAAIAVATIALATVLPPDMVDAAIVQQLLLTAFARRYHRVLQLAMEFEVVQHLQRASLADVLLLVQEAVAFYPPWRHTAGVHIADYQPFRHITYQLVRLPAAADTSLDDLAPLLRTASARECEFVIEALCSLPAAVDLPREECTLLLRQAVQHDLPRAVACLCKLKAAKCLSPTDWYDIVMTALTGSHAVGIKYLMQLEAAEGVSADAVAELLETAYHNEQLHVVEALQQLPAVVQISGGQMFAIVKVVVEQVSTLSLGRHVYHCSLLETLDKWTRYNTGMLMNITGAQLLELLSILLEHNCQCEPIASFVWSERMPVSLVPEGLMMQQNMRIIEQGNLVLLQAVCRHEATPVGPESVLQLWTAAAEMEDMISKSCSAEMQAELCKLRGAAQLNSSQLYGHMMSIVNNNRTVVPDWCRLSAQFTGSEVTDLLKTATRYQHTDNMRTLCGLKAAAALRCSQVYPLLAEVVNSNQTLVLQLCSLPAAAQLAAGQVLDLLMTAVKHGNSENVRSLCSLSASNKLNCNQLLAVIQTVVDSNQPLVPALWELPAAVQLTSTNVADLITAAMTQQNVNTVYMLCRSEAASKLSSNEMIGLISTAANCASPAMAEAVCSISTSEPVDVCKLEMILRKRRKCVQK